jgi:hypothetical protein
MRIYQEPLLVSLSLSVYNNERTTERRKVSLITHYWSLVTRGSRFLRELRASCRDRIMRTERSILILQKLPQQQGHFYVSLCRFFCCDARVSLPPQVRYGWLAPKSCADPNFIAQDVTTRFLRSLLQSRSSHDDTMRVKYWDVSENVLKTLKSWWKLNEKVL